MKIKNKGFTLIELLVVMAVLAILITAVLVAVNPASKFASARNAERRAHLYSIMSAIYQYEADNNGSPPAAITTSSTDIASGGIDLCGVLVTTGSYLPSMPYDPNASGASYTNCSSYDTKYFVSKAGSNNRITLTAPSAELGATISLVQ